jgi:hypothetical protein
LWEQIKLIKLVRIETRTTKAEHMIVLFAIASWILSLALVTGLCLAARRGDLQMHSDPLAESAGESIELFVIVREVAAHPSGRAAPHDLVSQPAVRHVEAAVRHVEAGRVRREDSSPRHWQTPGDLAPQRG